MYTITLPHYTDLPFRLHVNYIHIYIYILFQQNQTIIWFSTAMQSAGNKQQKLESTFGNALKSREHTYIYIYIYIYIHILFKQNQTIICFSTAMQSAGDKQQKRESTFGNVLKSRKRQRRERQVFSLHSR